MPTNDQDYALVIGINDYPLYGSRGRPLQGAIEDAAEFARWLKDKNSGGGLPDDHCILIESAPAGPTGPEPRKSKIDDALGEIKRLSDANGARRLYLYFSGHGQTRSSDDVALCMANWARDQQAAAISLLDYRNYFVECLKFEEIVMFMDCCRTRKTSARAQPPVMTCDLPAGGEPRWATAHATEWQASAHEAATGQISEDDEPIVRGHFTRALMAALNGAAARDEGGVSFTDLARYLKKVVPRIAKRHGHDQQPVSGLWNFVPGDDDEPVFGTASRIDTFDVKITFSGAHTGTVRLEGPGATMIREGEASTGPWEETLEAAMHMLIDVDTGEQIAVRPDASMGELDVEF